MSYLSGSNVQLGASYEVAREATRRYEEGYEAAARFVGAGRDEVGEYGDAIFSLLFRIPLR